MYELNKNGHTALQDWLNTNGMGEWNFWAVVEQIDDALGNRGEGESLSVEIRGPNGLLFFEPDVHQVNVIKAEE